MSLPEVLLWTRIRHRDPGFYPIRRQHPVGPYILDFYCSELNIGIEIDGYCHGCAGAPEHDARREAYLGRRGIRLIRYAAVSALRDPGEVAAGIMDLLRKPTPPPDWLTTLDALTPIASAPHP